MALLVSIKISLFLVCQVPAIIYILKRKELCLKDLDLYQKLKK